MWKCSYAGEEADVKLFCLKMIKKTGIILTAALLGAVFLGAVFFLKETVFAPEKAYQVVGETYIDYIPEEGYGISRVYITDEVWASLVKSDDFVTSVTEEVSAQGYSVSEEYIRNRVQAGVISDSRIVTTTVTSSEPRLAVAISTALQNAIVDFCAERQEVAESFVMASPTEAEKRTVVKEILVAALVGAVLGLVSTMTVLSISFFVDDSVDLPVTVEKRYGIPVFGTVHSKELAANLQQFLKSSDKIAVVGISEDADVNEVAEVLQQKCADLADIGKIFSTGILDMTVSWNAQIKEASGVVLVIAGGRKDGKRIEKRIDFLQKQEVKIYGAVLWDADEALIARYYSPGILKKGKNIFAKKKKAEDRA